MTTSLCVTPSFAAKISISHSGRDSTGPQRERFNTWQECFRGRSSKSSSSRGVASADLANTSQGSPVGLRFWEFGGKVTT